MGAWVGGMRVPDQLTSGSTELKTPRMATPEIEQMIEMRRNGYIAFRQSFLSSAGVPLRLPSVRGWVGRGGSCC